MALDNTMTFEGKITREIFYNDNTNYGIYTVETEDPIFMLSRDGKIKKNKEGRKISTTIVGNVQPLILDEKCEIRGTFIVDPKYGEQYKIIYVGNIIPKTYDERLNYLCTLTSKRNAEELLSKYPNIIDDIIVDNSYEPNYDDLHGIKESSYNIIKEKIIDTFGISRLLSFVAPLGLTITSVNSLVQKYENPNVIIYKIKKNPYLLVRDIPRLGFSKVDAFALNLDKSYERSMERVGAAIQDCLVRLGYDQGHTVIPAVQLEKEVKKMIPGAMDLFYEYVKECEEETKNYNINKMLVKDKLCSDAKIAKREAYIYNKLKLMQLNSEKTGEEFSDIPYEQVMEKTEKELGFSLSDEQKSVVKAVMKNNVVIISGKAGCVDCDTEFYNGKQWKPINSWTPEDQVLQYLENGNSELVTPLAYIKNKQDFLFHLTDGHGIDQCISAQHKIVYCIEDKIGVIDRKPKKGTIPYFYKRITNSKKKVYFISGFRNDKGISVSSQHVNPVKEKIWKAKKDGEIETVFHVKRYIDANKLQFLCAHLGYNAYVEKEKGYNVHVLLERNYMRVGEFGKYGKIKKELYKTSDGYEYCFTVPSGMLILRRNGRIFITGNSGKTTTIRSIVTAFSDKSIGICALSAKAAQRVKEVTGHDALTIHRMLKFNGIKFRNNRYNKLSYKIIILDEASMVGASLFYHLLEAIKTDSKFIIVGDHLQLPPIEEGAVFYDLLKQKNFDFVQIELSTVYRQAEDSGIITDANMIRTGLVPFKEMNPLVFRGVKNDMCYVFKDEAQDIQDAVIKLYLNYIKKGGSVTDISVISPRKNNVLNSCKKINERIQNLLIKKERDNFTEYWDKEFRVGDIVINTVNHYDICAFDMKAEDCKFLDIDAFEETEECNNVCYDTMLVNGETGAVIKTNDEEKWILVDWTSSLDERRKIIKHKQKELNDIDLAYCLTVHKKQGDQSKVVIFVVDKSHYIMLNSNLLYTGITRAEQKCIVVANKTMLLSGINNTKEQHRRTILSLSEKMKDFIESEDHDIL